MARGLVARRYAKALFQLAQEAGRVAEVRQELRAFGSLIETHPELAAVLLQPLHPAAQRRAVLEAVAAKLDASPLLRHFHSVLIDQRRLVDIAAIEQEYGRLADEAAGLLKARVRTAAPLAPEQREGLERALAARAGRRVTLEVDVDADLVGGLVAQLGDTLYDGSVRAQLEQLRANLNRD